MRQFLYNKLVRDGILTDMINKGETPVYHVLSDQEYVVELKKKLLEESTEITTDDPAKLLGELADLQEVIDSLLTATGQTKDDLQAAQQKKHAKVGGFSKRYFVASASLDDDNPWLAYLVANPDRYPEIGTESKN